MVFHEDVFLRLERGGVGNGKAALIFFVGFTAFYGLGGGRNLGRNDLVMHHIHHENIATDKMMPRKVILSRDFLMSWLGNDYCSRI